MAAVSASASAAAAATAAAAARPAPVRGSAPNANAAAAASSDGSEVVQQNRWEGTYPILTKKSSFPVCEADFVHSQAASTRACVQAVKDALCCIDVIPGYFDTFYSLSRSDRVDALLEMHLFLMSELYRVATAETGIKSVYESLPPKYLEEGGLLERMKGLQKLPPPWKKLWSQDVVPQLGSLQTPLDRAKYIMSAFNKTEFVKPQKRRIELQKLGDSSLNDLFENVFDLAIRTAIRSTQQRQTIRQLKFLGLVRRKLPSPACRIQTIARMITKPSSGPTPPTQSSASAAAAAAAAMPIPPPRPPKPNANANAAASPAASHEPEKKSNPNDETIALIRRSITQLQTNLNDTAERTEEVNLDLLKGLIDTSAAHQAKLDPVIASLEKWLAQKDCTKDPNIEDFSKVVDEAMRLEKAEKIQWALHLQPFLWALFLKITKKDRERSAPVVNGEVAETTKTIFGNLSEEFSDLFLNSKELPDGDLAKATTFFLTVSTSGSPSDRAEKLKSHLNALDDEKFRIFFQFAAFSVYYLKGLI